MVFARQVPGHPRESDPCTLEPDVVYGHADGVPLRYDLWRVKGARGPVPAVVVVHGGAWMNGDPSQAFGNARHFAAHGIGTVSISYRLAPAHRFPAQLDDVRRGLRHVRAHAPELGVDPGRLALLGLSAGAHLAALAHLASATPALAPDLPPLLRDVPEDVRAVMLHYGPYDLTRRPPRGGGSDPVAALMGERSGDPTWLQMASPWCQATHARAPFLLIHGTADAVVSHRESERMHEALLAAGRASELLLLEGAPHAFQMQWRGEANRRANAAMDDFLARHLLG
jgi:acetyl esterase/lipase